MDDFRRGYPEDREVKALWRFLGKPRKDGAGKATTNMAVV